MHIIKPARILEFARRHPAAAPALRRWYETARSARWQSLAETRMDFPSADTCIVASRRPVTVFNIAGNNFRFITAIHYDRARVFLLEFLSHADYSKGRWKSRL